MIERPAMILEVVFYATVRGGEPARKWLRSLPAEVRKIIGEDIKTVQFGWPLGMPLVRNMGGGLREARSNIPDGIARVLFMTHGAKMVLLHGFVKKTQVTPNHELKIARDRLKEVQNGQESTHRQ